MVVPAQPKGGNQGQIGERNNNRNFVALGRAAKTLFIKSPNECNKINIGFVAFGGVLCVLAARMFLYQVSHCTALTI